VTISDMIGVPRADRERVVAAADLLVTTSDPEAFGERAPVEVLGEALWTLTDFATELAAHRERNPGEDLMSALVQAEVDGERLTPGEKVVLFYHSANRDADAFAEPWRFDVTRDPNRHLGFGGGGPHYCLGASLARTQLRSLFAELLRVMPDIEAHEPELLRSPFIHGVKRMHCSFTPQA